MGSLVSAILANLVMEHSEKKATYPPKWWFIYVDDIHSCLPHEYVTYFHNHLNCTDEHIQFTRKEKRKEEENDNAISFLDTKTTRHEDGTITTDVYRKTTHG